MYVGISNNFSRRYTEHKSKDWIKEVIDIYVSEPMSRNQAHIYEIYYITKYSPKYNDHFVNGSKMELELKELKFLKI